MQHNYNNKLKKNEMWTQVGLMVLSAGLRCMLANIWLLILATAHAAATRTGCVAKLGPEPPLNRPVVFYWLLQVPGGISSFFFNP